MSVSVAVENCHQCMPYSTKSPEPISTDSLTTPRQESSLSEATVHLSMSRSIKRRRKRKLAKSSAATNLTVSITKHHSKNVVDQKQNNAVKANKTELCVSKLRTNFAATIPRQFPDLLSLPHEQRKKVPLLDAIKPENERSERERFMRANVNYNPLFVYIHPAQNVTLDRFGQASDKYLKNAIFILNRTLSQYGSYENFENVTGGNVLLKSQIYGMVKKYLHREGLHEEVAINLRDDLLSRASMTHTKGRPTLNIRTENLREHWCEGLLHHEIGTHYLRSSNNHSQPWHNWKVRRAMGLRNLNPTEEGLASLHSVIFRENPHLWRPALLYYTAFKASLMSFKDLFKDLARFVHKPSVRWDYCVRAKRGQTDTSKPGAFCKDQVYLVGALEILKHRQSINFELLMRLGKIAHEDVASMLMFAHLPGTRTPNFMHNINHYHKEIDRIAYANGLTDKILEDV